MKLIKRLCIILGYKAIALALVGCSTLLPTGSTTPEAPSSAGHITRAVHDAGGFSLLGIAGVGLIIAGGIVWAVLGNRRRGLLMIGVGAYLNVGMILVLEFMSYLFWPLLLALLLAGAAVFAPWLIRRWQMVRREV